MKTMIFAGVVALALTSMAQGTAPAATATAAPIKATAKKATTKKASKKTVVQQPATSQAAAPPAVEGAPVAAETAAPAATSVATNTAPAAPAKKWGASILVNPSSSFDEPTVLYTMTTLGGSYKVTDTWKASLKHTFQTIGIEGLKETDFAEADLRANNFRSAYSDLGLSRSVSGIFGSDSIALSMGYRHVSRDALMTRNGVLSTINAHFDLKAVVPWTLTPKTSLSLLTNYRHFDVNNDGIDRVIAQPSVSYAINDVVSVYQAAGLMYSTNKAWELRKRRERLLIETGVDIAPLKGLSINLNISQDKAVSSTTDEVSDFTLYKPNGKFDYVFYDASVSYSF